MTRGIPRGSEGGIFSSIPEKTEPFREDILNRLRRKESLFYENSEVLEHPGDYLAGLPWGWKDILETRNRLERWQPVVRSLFPETKDGRVESPLVEAVNLRRKLYPEMPGRLFLKLDSHLPLAGSVKARGGLSEVLRYAGDLLVREGVLKHGKDLGELEISVIRACLSRYTLAVASTGNLGLCIGFLGEALGFRVTVHMSENAREWKKKRLLDRGIRVVQHSGDFGDAMEAGRRQAEEEENVHFVDDESSADLFLGYAAAVPFLAMQLEELGLFPGPGNPLYVYLPCGVGGAPGGITFGLRHLFGEYAATFLAEPVASPSMLLGVMTRQFHRISVYDLGLDNRTELDGLAVARSSRLTAPLLEKLCAGFYTVQDQDMFQLLSLLKQHENIRIEPSAAPGLAGPKATGRADMPGIHIVWTTGGLFVPDEMYDRMYGGGKER